MIVVEDPRQSLYGDDICIKDIGIELPHFIVLRKEPVWPDVEKTPFIFDRARQPADLVHFFQNRNGRALLGQFIGRREPGRPGTDD